jgi:hypothetical protein
VHCVLPGVPTTLTSLLVAINGSAFMNSTAYSISCFALFSKEGVYNLNVPLPHRIAVVYLSVKQTFKVLYRTW